MEKKSRKKILSLKVRNEEYHQLALPFWKTPDFLLFTLAMINIAGMLATYFLASRKIDPREAVLWVALESGFILIVGNMLLELFKKSLSALKMKKDFISIISHQLRNPLTTIKWSLERIEKESALLSPRQKEHLKKINLANENLIELSSNFIFLEKIEDGSPVKKEKTDILAVLKKKSSEFMLLAESKKIKINIVSGKKNLFALTNSEFLMIIFDNFFSNALRYSFEESVVSARIKEEDGWVKVFFENVGVRLQEDETRLIFEKFYRSQSAINFSPQGSGLGLYISKVLTEKMKGKLGVFSKGKKTVFWVAVPKFKEGGD